MKDLTQYDKAMLHAHLKGFSRDSEDFAQDLQLNLLEGRTPTSMSNHFIDYIREQYGMNTETSPKPKALLAYREVSPEDLTHNPNTTNPIDFQLMIKHLTQKEKAYLSLQHQWGFTLKEIGNVFSVSEGRVAQELKEINQKLRKKGLRDTPVSV